MPSENAKAVAQEVIAAVGNGRIPHKTKIAISKGYSPESARSGKATQAKSYKDEITAFVQRMERERDRIIRALAKKALDREKYRDMIDGLDKLTKNIQLLSGGKTSNDEINIHWEE